MDKNKLSSLAESIMIASDDTEIIGRGAEKIVSYIKRIEDFTKENVNDLPNTDYKGELLTEIERDVAKGNTDKDKCAISLSSRERDGFVVIPRVV